VHLHNGSKIKSVDKKIVLKTGIFSEGVFDEIFFFLFESHTFFPYQVVLAFINFGWRIYKVFGREIVFNKNN
jgi:hypothetical protein